MKLLVLIVLIITLNHQGVVTDTTDTVLSTREVSSLTQSTVILTTKTTIDTNGDIILTKKPDENASFSDNVTEPVTATATDLTSTRVEYTTPPEIQLPACSYKPCRNNGTCTDDPTDSSFFNCSCLKGFIGTRCRTKDNCIVGNNGGLCENGTCVYEQDSSTRMCKCFFGTFWDVGQKRCRGPEPPCFPNPCSNGGRCSFVEDEVTCACVKGFEGSRCEIRNECINASNCKNGECVSTAERKYCKCNEQYYYDDASESCKAVNVPCQPNPCKNGGQCNILSFEEYNCTCSKGFVGETCSIRDFCESDVVNEICLNGECVNKTDSRVCLCNKGYYMHEDSHMCRKINPPCFPDPCKNDGICNILSPTTHNCTCPDGFTGEHCTDLDFCVLNGGNNFCNEANCTSQRQLGIFVCECGEGKYFDYSTRKCKEVDFCPLLKCDINEECKASRCQCSANYKKDNDTGTCKQDFCSSKPCPVTGMDCTEDALEGYKCSCKEGCAFNDTHCNRANCVFPIMNTCSQKCEILKGAPQCSCFNDDFQLNDDNKTCTYVGNATCTNKTCDGGICQVKDDAEICLCKTGFTLVGDKCIDICSSGELPRGLCPGDRCEQTKSGGFRCKCEGKYQLSSDKTTCTARKMCLKNEAGWKACSARSAICVEDWSLPNGYKCQCAPGEVENNVGMCVGVCSQDEDQRRCADRGAICRVSGSGRRVCRCPAFFHALGDGEQCNKPAQTSYLLNLPLHIMSYVNNSPKKSRSMQFEDIQPDIHYAKIRTEVQAAMRALFPEFIQANVLICRRTRDYLDCKVELQFLSIEDQDLKRLQVTDVCQEGKDTTNTACLLPPSLKLRTQFVQTTMTTAKTDPCDEDLKTEMCGSETVCTSSADKKTFNCTCGSGFAARSKRFLFGTAKTFIESCKDIDECALVNPCADHMECRNTLGSYTCTCLPGYRLKPSSGSRSQTCVELCNPNPCVHGQCLKEGDNEYECRCDAGFRGTLCNLQDEHFKRARTNTIIVGAVLGGVLLLTIILFIACVSRLKKNKCADDPDNMLYATELTERNSGTTNNAFQKD